MSITPSNLFLGSILSTGYKKGDSGIVTFTLPRTNITGLSSNPNMTQLPLFLRGWLAENPAIKLGNIWQPAFPSLESLTRLTSVMSGTKDTLAWLAGSQSAWAGLMPLEISITFFLFSIDSSSTIKKDVLNLQLLASIDATGTVEGVIHGGYKPRVLEPNNYISNNSVGNAYSNINGGTEQGFITISIGDQIVLPKMLLVDVTAESSSLTVPSKNPLYMKVTANFKSYRPFNTDELQKALNPGG